ncbi:MAG: hypothetical protein EKK57_02815 [Proteobacteria bacterium]|nr:MAG: hypothetical protein EKK57_02815 [Pseudomonadota bacterium]
MSEDKKASIIESVLHYWPIILLIITLIGGAFTSVTAGGILLYKFNRSETENVKQFTEILGKLDKINDTLNQDKLNINNVTRDLSHTDSKVAEMEKRLSQVEQKLAKN